MNKRLTERYWNMLDNYYSFEGYYENHLKMDMKSAIYNELRQREFNRMMDRIVPRFIRNWLLRRAELVREARRLAQ